MLETYENTERSLKVHSMELLKRHSDSSEVSKEITWKSVDGAKLKIALVKRQLAVNSFPREMRNPHLVESHAKYMLSVLKKCVHPNLLEFGKLHLEISLNGADDSSLFLFIVQNGPLSDIQAKKWFSQLVSAVECFHQNNFPLRDICLQHIFIDKEDNVKLCYFEYPEQFKIKWGSNREVKKVWGSPVYAAPEAVTQSESYDSFCADIWSLGVVLYAFLNGSLPFIDNFYGYGMNSEEVYVRILSTNHLNFCNSITYLGKDLLSRMMAVNCSMRSRIWEIRYHPWLAEYYQSLLFPLTDSAAPKKVEPSPLKLIDYPLNPVSSLNLREVRDSPSIGTHMKHLGAPSPAFKDHKVSEEDSFYDEWTPVKPLVINKKAPNTEIHPRPSYSPSPARSVVPRIKNNFVSNGSPRVSQVIGKENIENTPKKLSIPPYSERRMSRRF